MKHKFLILSTKNGKYGNCSNLTLVVGKSFLEKSLDGLDSISLARRTIGS